MTGGESIFSILAFVKNRANKKTQITIWGVQNPLVSVDGKMYYNNRLITDFADNKLFTLKITNTEYRDTGEYSVQAVTGNLTRASHVVTVDIKGIFFGFF